MKNHNLIEKLFGTLGVEIHRKSWTEEYGIEPMRRVLLQESPLAGYQYHRAAGIWSFLRVGDKLHLRREPGNPHDPDAIAVWFKNEHLGYVPRRENRTLAQMMDREERLEARIVRLLEDDNPWRRIRFRVDLRLERF